MDLRRATDRQPRRNSRKQPQIQRPVKAQPDVGPFGEAHISVDTNIRVWPAKLRRLDLQTVAGRTKVHRAHILKLYVRIVEHQPRELCVQDDALWPLQ